MKFSRFSLFPALDHGFTQVVRFIAATSMVSMFCRAGAKSDSSVLEIGRSSLVPIGLLQPDVDGLLQSPVFWVMLILLGVQTLWIACLHFAKRRSSYQIDELATNETQLHSWLLHAPISISVFKQTGETVIVNERFTQLLGYDASDFGTAKDMWSVLIQDESKRKPYLERWLQQIEQPWSHKWQAEEVVVTAKSGRTKSLETHVSKIGDYWICLHNDVTWRSQVERQLENALNQTFRANVAKTQFLTNMSHEIRTPLNGVLGMSQLLSETDMTSEQRMFLETIQTSGEMLLLTINEILDLSKIEAGSMELESVPFNFIKCIEDSIAVCLAKLDKNRVKFSSIIDSNVPSRIRGDAFRISQIIVNLLGNAVKYTAEGSIELRVGKIESSDESVPAKLSISVKDTGIGIPLEKQAQIFEPFEQADASITRNFGGTGLGLTICKRLAERMNGEITVTSQPSGGSEFTFTWVPEELHQLTSTQSEPTEIESWVSSKGVDFKTLVVEDNPVNAKVIDLSLQKFGISCEKCSNGVKALEELKKQHYDLVFMDIQMPEMDGLKCTEIIRSETPESLQPFIIALTAHALAEHMEQCRKAGMNGFLSKPYTSDDLKKALELFLKERESPRTNVYF